MNKRNLISYIMLMPYGVVFFIFIFIPAIVSVFLSFTSFNMLQTPNFVGMSNYIRLILDDDIFLIAIKNTLILAVITGPIGYVMSFVLAWLINELGSKMRSIPTIVFYMPSLAGNIFFIWKFIFDNDSYGLLNGWMIRLGFMNEPIRWLTDPKYGLFVVSVVVLWMSAGAGFLTFIAGLQSMNRDLFEAAAIDGIRNRWQELWFVTLPQMKPQLLLGAIFTISGSFAIGHQSQALTGFPSTDYSTHTILLHIIDYGFIRYEMGYACAIQLVLFGVMLLSWYGVNRFLRKWES